MKKYLHFGPAEQPDTFDWARRLFGRHVHKWKHFETVHLKGGREVTPMGREIICRSRDVHYRRCTECQEEQEYFP